MKMTTEYMVDLHKFLYLSNDTDLAKLIERVQNHLLYIPRRKLYRYRKSTDREIATLAKNSIWLSDPESFPDIFDATIPLQDDITIGIDHAFHFTAEVAYKALVEIAEEGEVIPSKEVFIQAMRDAKERYNTAAKMELKMREIYGDEYEEIREITRATPQHNELVTKLSKRAIELVRYIGQLPRESMCIASFTTDRDNRNMWENYAKNYSGFCVEYSFRKEIPEINSKNAWDMLHLLPVSYCAKRPIFDHNKTLQSIVMQDTKQDDTYVDLEEYLKQGYKAVTTKLSDYRSEKEWRLVMQNKYQGIYDFPYVSAIYLGKDMPDRKIDKMIEVGQKLGVPVFLQFPANHGDRFEYFRIDVE